MKKEILVTMSSTDHIWLITPHITNKLTYLMLHFHFCSAPIVSLLILMKMKYKRSVQKKRKNQPTKGKNVNSKHKQYKTYHHFLAFCCQGVIILTALCQDVHLCCQLDMLQVVQKSKGRQLHRIQLRQGY